MDITSTWSEVELEPYRNLYNQKLDPEYPASPSTAVVTDLLRGTMGFRGTVITDAGPTDGAAQSPVLRVFDPGAVGRTLSRRARNLAYVAVWTVVVGAMSAAQGIGDSHPGQWLPFWQRACREVGCAARTQAVAEPYRPQRLLARWCHPRTDRPLASLHSVNHFDSFEAVFLRL